MKFLGKIGKVVDSTIAVFSPERALKRHFCRERLEKVRSSQYAAAKTTRLTGSWSPVDSNVNDIIGASSPAVRARVRQLVRDFPYFARAANVLADYTVGSGIILQSRIKTPDGKLDKKRIQQVEDAFNFWADEADVAGKLHYYEMMQLAKRQDVESGEFLIVQKPQVRNRNRYLPFALQIYECDWLSSVTLEPKAKTNEIKQGIEYEKSTGQVVAYHLVDPDGWGKTVRILAKDVIHGFQTFRPGQLRGISPFAPGVLVANDLSNYMDAEIDAAKMAAKYLAFVKSPDPAFRQSGTTVDSDTEQRIDELENAIIEYLGLGEDITIASNPRPGDNFSPFVRLILCMLSITTGVPYELLSGDYLGVNYSTMKTARNDFSKQLRPLAVRHIRHFAQKTFVPFMDAAVLAGKLDLPGYWVNPIPYLKCEWQPPGMESIDPLRETKAQIDEVKTGLRSPQEIIKARGRDLEDVYKEIAAAKELAEELGLSFEDISTAMANNPAAITGEDNEKGSNIPLTVLTSKQ